MVNKWLMVFQRYFIDILQQIKKKAKKNFRQNKSIFHYFVSRIPDSTTAVG